MPDYDYIVIGGGTAGLVVANRLTEDPTVRVLVIEAGADRNKDPKITIPGLATTTYGDPDYDWKFRSVPQDGLYGKSLDLTRGKVLGGSSAINIMALIYPHRSTFEAWEKDLGNKGWGWDDLRPYYNKALSTQDPGAAIVDGLGVKPLDRTLHGDKGPIKSSYTSCFGEPVKAWLPTFRNLDLEAKNDSRTGDVWGAYLSVATIDREKGQRSHAGNAYHEPAKERENYHAITEALVEKIVLEKQSNGEVQAKGVQYQKGGKTEVAFAKQEVILSAGVYGTPQILELSGIGDPGVLNKFNIEAVVENKFVGENLQDHPLSGLCFEVKDGIPTTDMIRDPAVIQASMAMYQKDKTGPLTSPFGGCTAMLPVQEWTTAEGKKELKTILDDQVPHKTGSASKLPSLDLQYSALRRSIQDPQQASGMFGLGTIQMHFDKEVRKEVFALTSPENYVVVLSALNSPFSRGSTHISSSDPRAQPSIDPAYLSHPLDVEIYARQIRFVEKVAQTEPFASVLKAGGGKLPQVYDLSTVEKAKEHIRRHTISYNHGSSSCPMLPRELGGVVDTELRVYGVKGLRIVDASIMPIIPKGNIQSSVYAIAEKAADILQAGA